MFDTKKQRGLAIAVVGLAVVLAAFVVDLAGKRLAQGDAELAAQELEAVLDRFESVADVQLAMASAELGLPEGSSLRFVDSCGSTRRLCLAASATGRKALHGAAAARESRCA